MKKSKGLVIATFLLLLAFMAAAQVKWKGTVAKEGDVTVVRNPKEPLYNTPILELKEELSLGDSQAQGDYAFGQIRSFTVDDAGSIYVLDYKDSHIKVFAASGEYVRTFGRKGQGPGEFDNPLMLSINRTSSELVVFQVSRKMSFFKTDGTFLRHVLFKDVRAGRGLVDSKGNIYIMEARRELKDSRYVIKKLAADASVIATLAESPAPSGESFNPFMPVGWFDVDRGDTFIYGYPETYEIRFFGASNQKVHKKIIRDYDPVAVTAGERERQEKAAQGTDIVFDFPKYHPAYSRFFLSDLGHVVVQTWEKAKDGKFAHDIFDAEGRFIGRVPLKPSGVEILNGKYYALEEDEEGYRLVKRYNVTWTII